MTNGSWRWRGWTRRWVHPFRLIRLTWIRRCGRLLILQETKFGQSLHPDFLWIHNGLFCLWTCGAYGNTRGDLFRFRRHSRRARLYAAILVSWCMWTPVVKENMFNWLRRLLILVLCGVAGLLGSLYGDGFAQLHKALIGQRSPRGNNLRRPLPLRCRVVYSSHSADGLHRRWDYHYIHFRGDSRVSLRCLAGHGRCSWFGEASSFCCETIP